MGVTITMTCCDTGADVMALGTEGARFFERSKGCFDVTQSQLPERHMTAVEVEIDIFSGMPNPHWMLSESDAAVFVSKLSGLQKTAARLRSVNLGYRGLVIRMPQGAGRTIYIQNGVVEVSDGTSRTFFLDPQRSLERWLIGTGRKFLSDEVLEAIDEELKK